MLIGGLNDRVCIIGQASLYVDHTLVGVLDIGILLEPIVESDGHLYELWRRSDAFRKVCTGRSVHIVLFQLFV